MGKIKKLKPSQVASKASLEEDIEQTKFAQSKNRNKIRNRRDEEEQFVESNLSKKILKIAREQQRELQPVTELQNSVQKIFVDTQDSDSEEEVLENVQEYEGFFDNMQISQEDEEAIKKFMSSNPKPKRTLEDVIMDKLTEKKTELESQFSDTASVKVKNLDPKAAAQYEGCAEVLKKYRSGKLPKAFKCLHKYNDWEEMLYLTEPSNWSAAAMYQATRIFASNLDESRAQKFYHLVLLPRVRDDLAEYKKLNFHLYQALIKAIYKPKAFMTGLIFPLLESGDCTLREAIIIGSVIDKYSVPVLHSSTALFKIAQMDYTGANSIFLRILLDKKYSLPYQVVDVVHNHFMDFLGDEREMPVLWHQALLTFVQRYKSDITFDQRSKLYTLLEKQRHHEITPVIHRELMHAKCRNNPV